MIINNFFKFSFQCTERDSSSLLFRPDIRFAHGIFSQFKIKLAMDLIKYYARLLLFEFHLELPYIVEDIDYQKHLLHGHNLLNTPIINFYQICIH